jgi:hypothetical protein
MLVPRIMHYREARTQHLHEQPGGQRKNKGMACLALFELIGAGSSARGLGVGLESVAAALPRIVHGKDPLVPRVFGGISCISGGLEWCV